MSSNNAVELKGGLYTFMSLRLRTQDLDAIDAALADKVNQAPAFFKDTPVVVDLGELDAASDTLDGEALLACIRRHRLHPVAASLSERSSPLAARVSLPLIDGGARRRDAPARVAEGGTAEAAEKDAQEAGETRASPVSSSVEAANDALATSREVEYVIKAPLLIDRPVRSGQQLYARDTDLIVMGQVGAGAEVIADNNIHIYGPLRGRALCGVSGNTATRIFCQSLEAELVSVAGNYRMLETIPEALRGRPAQIWLDHDRLSIEPL